VKEQEKQTKKRWQYIKSNFINGLFIIVMLILIFNPNAKALVIKGLMQVGLFRPDIDSSGEDHEAAADATFTNVSGKAINLSSLKGKVVFLNFWATWCPPCIAEMPGINELYKQFSGRSDVVFVMVDADGNLISSETYMKAHGYNLPLYIAASGLVSNLFTGTLPSTLIIDRTGKIVFRETGAANYNTKQFAAFMNKLAAK
jgi:thiol-disulfide isomerase/thioredoxin